MDVSGEVADLMVKESIQITAETVKLLREEKDEIRQIYRKEFAASGDKVRMELALLWPQGYYGIVKIYDKLIVPLRQ